MVPMLAYQQRKALQLQFMYVTAAEPALHNEILILLNYTIPYYSGQEKSARQRAQRADFA
ncbi:MAG: hypothetical protein COW10_02965 [Candidatus Omnitrophica bacterium CG12_big_fil_rev_8_21_14_0_65_42_8]|nr:MAG: hypothetical protein COW10_02965 [Candidatus Omnitrophica bacterium CG12_big_fil_rev_8_21_14_0_65_42_8]